MSHASASVAQAARRAARVKVIVIVAKVIDTREAIGGSISSSVVGSTWLHMVHNVLGVGGLDHVRYRAAERTKGRSLSPKMMPVIIARRIRLCAHPRTVLGRGGVHES